jgi:hypothetical protein
LALSVIFCIAMDWAEAARREAIVACAELLREVPAQIWKGVSLRLWVTDRPDGQGDTLYSLNVSPGAR